MSDMQLSQANLKKKISEFLKIEDSSFDDQTELKNLVQDSFLLVELVMGLQEDFDVRVMQDDLRDVKTAGDLIQVFLKQK